jgi:serine/threonine protein kinase
MDWIKKGQFRIVANRPGKRYVYRRSNNGNSEYNLPNSVKNKQDAKRFLIGRKPNRYRAARKKGPNNRYLSAMNAFRQAARPKPVPRSPNLPKSPQYPGIYTCSSGRGLKLLGKGRQGIVFKGQGFAAKVCPRDLAAASRGEKQPALVEYDIQTAVFKACPDGVVEPYEHLKCLDFIRPSTMNMSNVQNSRKYDKSKQSIIFMEFCAGGSLEDWLTARGKTDAVLHHVISSVIKSLGKIYKKYPNFRHNDLWPANVMVAHRGFLLGDFGWSRLEKTGTNPAVNTANGTNTAGKWGVGPATDPRYDYHFFLNNIRDFVRRRGGMPKTMEFLDWAVPPGYRGSSDTHVNEWRLKYNDPCPGLHSFSELLRCKYISGRKVTSPDLVAVRSKLVPRAKTPTPIASLNLRAAKRKLKPVHPRRVISPAQLVAARRKLKAGRKTKHIPSALLKNSQFDKLVEFYWRNNGAVSGKNYDEAWSKARDRAIRLVELRLNRGNRPFNSAKNVKAAVLAPPRPAPAPAPPIRRVSPPKPVVLAKKLVIKVKTPPTRIISPPRANSGRPKVMGDKGRMVYADRYYGLANLKKLAANRKTNIKGLRSKANIARKIFT